MPSVVDICNMSLDKVGQTAIISLEDGNKAADLCARNWPLVRDEVLRAHPWNFAMRRTTLAPDAEAPAWGYTYQSTLPTDFLRVVELNDLLPDEYQIEGGKVQSNESVLYLRYITRVEDPNQYDAQFVTTAALRLAAENVEALTQSSGKKRLLLAEYRDSLNDARFTDGQENPTAPLDTDSWEQVRY